MNTRNLGIIALVCAPFLMIDSVYNDLDPYRRSTYSGLFNFIYMAGWICSLVALKKIKIFGPDKFSRWIYYIQLSFLILGEGWSIYEMLKPGASTPLYYFLDAFWPISNVCMFFTGGAILLKGNLKGWMRFVPFAVGCWLPLWTLCWALFGRTVAVILAANIYSALMWSLMAIVVIIISHNGKRKQTTDVESAALALRRYYQ